MSDNAPRTHEFRVERNTCPSITAHFPAFIVTYEREGTTLLHGPVADQSALHGVLARIRDLGLTLLELRQDASPRSCPAEGER